MSVPLSLIAHSAVSVKRAPSVFVCLPCECSSLSLQVPPTFRSCYWSCPECVTTRGQPSPTTPLFAVPVPAVGMPILLDVGKVSVDGGTTLRWTLPRYMQMLHGMDTYLRSPDFTFRGVKGCRLCVQPNGFKWEKSGGWTGIRCLLRSLPRASTVTCCMVGSEGREILHTETTEWVRSYYIQHKWILRSELESRSEELFPGGTLRVVVRVVLPDERGHRAEEEEEEASGARADSTSFSESSASDASRRHVRKFSPASLGSEISVTKTEENSDIESHTQNNEGAEAGVTGFSGSSVTGCTRLHIDNGLEQLSENLKDLYLQGEGCDLIFKVRDKEYPAHRSILRARIPAFDATFGNGIVVSIQDCDPEIFQHFLLYIYSGRLEDLSRENVLGLSNLARRYGLRHLKNACIQFLRRSHPIKKNNIIILAA